MQLKFRLDEIMSELGLSYQKLSQGADVSTSILYKICHNKQRQIDLGVMGRILDFTGLRVDDLIIIEDEG